MRLLIALVLIIGIAACGTGSAPENRTEPESARPADTVVVSEPVIPGLIEVYWKLLRSYGIRPSPPSKGIAVAHLTFGPEKIHGFSGCNTIAGNYAITNSNTIDFEPELVTDFGCSKKMEEERFIKMLAQSKSFVQIDGFLMLFDQARDTIGMFRAVPDLLLFQ